MSANEFTFVQALKHYFEIPADKMVREFKALSDNDKADFRAMLIAEGYNPTN